MTQDTNKRIIQKSLEALIESEATYHHLQYEIDRMDQELVMLKAGTLLVSGTLLYIFLYLACLILP